MDADDRAGAERLRAAFLARFATEPLLFRAPGRVNLIGEHTDYNDGFVLPAAIGFTTTVAIAPRSDARLRVYSANMSEMVEAPLPTAGTEGLQRAGAARWPDYVFGVAWALGDAGVPLRGADLLIQGEVPLGSGLSSSAALEVACALALTRLAGVSLAPARLAQICQRAENLYVGTRCGIMDQFAAVHGRAGHAMLLDCRSLEHRLVPLGTIGSRPGDVSLVVCNTLVRHELAAGAYNQRRQECEQGLRILAGILPGIRALRDVTGAALAQHAGALDEVSFRRCRHVVAENERVLAAVAALDAGDLAAFGVLMGASHRSLRDDYAVSCVELDLLVDLAGSIPGVLGARMTGGGFGGCTVNLVRHEALAVFRREITRGYAATTGIEPEIHVCRVADGATAVHLQGT